MTLTHRGRKVHVSPERIAEVQSATHTAILAGAPISKLAALARVTSNCIRQVARRERGVTAESARRILRAIAKVDKQKPPLPKRPDDALSAELRRDAKRALEERFGGSAELLARAVNLPVEVVRSLLLGHLDYSPSLARRFAPLRRPAPLAVLSQAPPAPGPAYPMAAPLSELGQGRTLSASISFSALLSPRPATPASGAATLRQSWGLDAIRYVLQEAERAREAR